MSQITDAAADTREPQAVAALREELMGAGLWEILEDPELTDLVIHGEVVFVTTLSKGTYRAQLAPDPLAVESLIASIASYNDRYIEPTSPILEARLPFWNLRVEAVVPPAAERPILALRKPPAHRLSLDELVERKTLTAEQAQILRDAVRNRQTLVIAGGTGSGKTTLLIALLDDLIGSQSAGSPERLVILEEGAREIHVEGENVLRLVTVPESKVDMRRLVRTALRLAPDRIIVGEVRGAEAHDWIKSCATGHPGSLGTLHASSAEDTLARLDDLVQEAGVPSQLPRIGRALDAIVFMERQGPLRRVVEIARVGRLASEEAMNLLQSP